jgi:hypothetical protein
MTCPSVVSSKDFLSVLRLMNIVYGLNDEWGKLYDLLDFEYVSRDYLVIQQLTDKANSHLKVNAMIIYYFAFFF